MQEVRGLENLPKILRVLDALAQGKKNADIGEVLCPEVDNVYPTFTEKIK